MVPNLTLIEVRSWVLVNCNTTVLLTRYTTQAKKFVESLPKVLKEGLSKEDAEKLKKTFTDLGGVIVLE